MSISEVDFIRYIKPILDDESLWRDDNIFWDATVGNLSAQLINDGRDEDLYEFLEELENKRDELRDKYPLEEEQYVLNLITLENLSANLI